MKTIRYAGYFFWILYLSIPFLISYIAYLLPKKIAEKFIGRKLIYDQDLIARNIFRAAVAIFLISACLVYYPIFHDVYNQISNFEFDKFFAASGIYIIGCAIFFLIIILF